MKRHAAPHATAFSLVEVTLALAILAFSLISLAALLPAGLRSNQITVEESRAADLLSLMESDLRNTHPAANAGKSQLFGLVLPYKVAAGKIAVNDLLQTNTLGAGYSVGVQEDGSASAISATPMPRFQATVLYTSVPAGNSATPIQARLIVNWPPTASTDPGRLTAGRGYLEAFVTFPVP